MAHASIVGPPIKRCLSPRVMTDTLRTPVAASQILLPARLRVWALAYDRPRAWWLRDARSRREIFERDGLWGSSARQLQCCVHHTIQQFVTTGQTHRPLMFQTADERAVSPAPRALIGGKWICFSFLAQVEIRGTTHVTAGHSTGRDSRVHFARLQARLTVRHSRELPLRFGSRQTTAMWQQ
jgi:hypothetical protein